MSSVPTNAVSKTWVARGMAATNSAGATHNGTGMDRMTSGGEQGFMSATLHLNGGAASGTPTSFTVDCSVEESDDNSAWTAVTGTALTQLTASGESRLRVNLKGRKRYVRSVVITAFVGGTSPAVPVSTTWEFAGAVKIPVNSLTT